MRSARKHIGWTLRGLPGGEAFRAAMNAIETCDAQVARGRPTGSTRLADTHAADAAPRGGRRRPLTIH